MYPTEEGRVESADKYMSLSFQILRTLSAHCLSLGVSYIKALNVYNLLCPICFYAELFQVDTKVVLIHQEEKNLDFIVYFAH